MQKEVLLLVTDEEFLGWKKEVDSNPILKKQGFKLVNIKTHYLFVGLGILFLLISASFVGVLFYLGTEGKLSSTIENIINPLFNATVLIENNYDFKPVNEYNPNNNFTIIVNLPENLCGGCNGTV